MSAVARATRNTRAGRRRLPPAPKICSAAATSIGWRSPTTARRLAFIASMSSVTGARMAAESTTPMGACAVGGGGGAGACGTAASGRASAAAGAASAEVRAAEDGSVPFPARPPPPRARRGPAAPPRLVAPSAWPNSEFARLIKGGEGERVGGGLVRGKEGAREFSWPCLRLPDKGRAGGASPRGTRRHVVMQAHNSDRAAGPLPGGHDPAPGGGKAEKWATRRLARESSRSLLHIFHTHAHPSFFSARHAATAGGDRTVDDRDRRREEAAPREGRGGRMVWAWVV